MNKLAKFALISGSALVLAACGNNNQQPQQQQQQQPQQQQTAQQDQGNQQQQQPQQQQQNQQNNQNNQQNNNQGSGMNQTQQTTGQQGQGLETMTFSLSLEQAVETFMNNAGQGTLINEIKLEMENGIYVYQINGYNGNQEIETDIDANTGNIVKNEVDTDDDIDQQVIELANIITPQEAMEKALQNAGAGFVKEWELDLENGRTVYKVDLEGGAMDQRIDAVSGDIL